MEKMMDLAAAGTGWPDGQRILYKEETDMAEQETKIPAQEETQTAPPMKLDVSVRTI